MSEEDHKVLKKLKIRTKLGKKRPEGLEITHVPKDADLDVLIVKHGVLYTQAGVKNLVIHSPFLLFPGYMREVLSDSLDIQVRVTNDSFTRALDGSRSGGGNFLDYGVNALLRLGFIWPEAEEYLPEAYWGKAGWKEKDAAIQKLKSCTTEEALSDLAVSQPHCLETLAKILRQTKPEYEKQETITVQDIFKEKESLEKLGYLSPRDYYLDKFADTLNSRQESGARSDIYYKIGFESGLPCNLVLSPEGRERWEEAIATGKPFELFDDYSHVTKHLGLDLEHLDYQAKEDQTKAKLLEDSKDRAKKTEKTKLENRAKKATLLDKFLKNPLELRPTICKPDSKSLTPPPKFESLDTRPEIISLESKLFSKIDRILKSYDSVLHKKEREDAFIEIFNNYYDPANTEEVLCLDKIIQAEHIPFIPEKLIPKYFQHNKAAYNGELEGELIKIATYALREQRTLAGFSSGARAIFHRHSGYEPKPVLGGSSSSLSQAMVDSGFSDVMTYFLANEQAQEEAKRIHKSEEHNIQEVEDGEEQNKPGVLAITHEITPSASPVKEDLHIDPGSGKRSKKQEEGNGAVVEGVKELELAENQDDPNTQYSLAVRYENGTGGIEQNLKEAVRLYQLAAAQNHSEAQYNLARCYRDGIGVEQDIGEARRLYQLAAEQDHEGAQVALQRIPLHKDVDSKARQPQQPPTNNSVEVTPPGSNPSIVPSVTSATIPTATNKELTPTEIGDEKTRQNVTDSFNPPYRSNLVSESKPFYKKYPKSTFFSVAFVVVDAVETGISASKLSYLTRDGEVLKQIIDGLNVVGQALIKDVGKLNAGTVASLTVNGALLLAMAIVFIGSHLVKKADKVKGVGDTKANIGTAAPLSRQ